MPPQKPKPWTDVFPALWWGNSAPQNMEQPLREQPTPRSATTGTTTTSARTACGSTSSRRRSSDGKKRPVLFWLHGGGFVNGNAIEQDGYNGENLARFGDAVFCSINHRLGPLGYCDLAGVGGEKFAASGNVGMLDIVAALEWVRDNIAHFGGDPGNVTIMGQSRRRGEGLRAHRDARGEGPLPQGGGAERRVADDGREGRTPRSSAPPSLEEAGLTPARDRQAAADALEGLLRAREQGAAEARASQGPAAGMRRGFNPVVDGVVLPQHPYFPERRADGAPACRCSSARPSTSSRRAGATRRSRRSRSTRWSRR